MNLLSIKAKLLGFGALLLTIAAFFFRFQQVKDQRDRARESHKKEKARANQAEKINEVEDQLDQEYSDLKRESERDIKNGEMPTNIRDRNDF